MLARVSLLLVIIPDTNPVQYIDYIDKLPQYAVNDKQKQLFISSWTIEEQFITYEIKN